MNFFKQVLATIVGLTIFQIISLILFFIFIGALVASVKTMRDGLASETVSVEDNSILVLDLAYDILERDAFSSFDFTDLNSFPKEKPGLQSIVNAIEYAKTDDRIKGIYLKSSVMPNGYATVELLRTSLKDFQSSGKFVLAYGEMLDQKSFYLASAASELYVNPEGYIELRGIGAQLTFFKKLIEEKLEAEVQVFKVGDYKSAVEPFILDKMSDANREQLSYLLGGIKEDFVNNIATERGLSPDDFNTILNNLSALRPDSCAYFGLITGTSYYDEVLRNLKEKLELAEKEDLNTIDVGDYALATAKTSNSENRIAVVYAEGDIVDGKGDESNIGGESFSKQIRALRLDDDIDAIVLRINSPGGSALASEVMWRELELAKQVKPVVVSMGDLAASGGYYIACNANRIFAEENTITGSIGVFGLIPNLEKFLNNKIGVSFDEVLLNDHATSTGITKKLDSFEAKVIQSSVDDIYATFTS
ncbi:MAG: signal peptide peptidase SppA, partial [Bacteroidetes bacterium]|nr:signal peptide peptidase SppA [Bacteroidota bacterium]